MIDSFFHKVVLQKKKILLYTIYLSVIFFYSCKKVESNLGKEVQNLNDELGIIKTDTFKVITYSKKRDSVRSDEEVNPNVMLGSYVDPIFGNVSAGFAGQYRLSGTNPVFGEIGSDLVVDSFILSLQYNKSYYGKLNPQNVYVHKLNKSIQKDSNFYNFSTPSYDISDLVQIGKNKFVPNPVDSILVGTKKEVAQLRIPLNKAIAEDLVNKSATIMVNDNAFVTEFPGLYVEVKNPSQSVSEGGVFSFQSNGVSTKSRLTIYFTKLPSNEKQEFSFFMNSSSGYFNKISYNHSGTVVGSQTDADSSLGMNEFYAQAGAIESRIYLPTITDLIGKKVAINKAELILPIQYFSNSPEFPPSLLDAFVVSKNTNKLTPVDVKIPLIKEEKEYRVDVTRLILFIQNGERENEEIVILPRAFTSSVERLIFNGPNSFLKKKPKLEITYTEY